MLRIVHSGGVRGCKLGGGRCLLACDNEADQLATDVLTKRRVLWSRDRANYSVACPSSLRVKLLVLFFIVINILECTDPIQCLHGLAPQYLSRCCIPLAAVPGRSQLRSADEGHLLVHRTSTSTLGPRAFYSSGPASWNSLPTALRHPDLSLGVFKRQLKTVLFSWM